jgi:hypothetical protein
MGGFTLDKTFNPYDVLKIEESIEAIANCLYLCPNICNSNEIVCEKDNGIIPRCLFFEHEGRNLNDKGCVVVGLCPGTASDEERNFIKDLMKNGVLNYKQLLKSFLTHGYKGRFYGPIREFLKACQIEGPILWTEVAHCQTELIGKKKLKSAPPSRIATSICSRNYLSAELKAVPEDWLIIAVGKDAFEILLPMCPNNMLIGIPHPAYFEKQFSQKFITRVKDNPESYIRDITSLKSSEYLLLR